MLLPGVELLSPEKLIITCSQLLIPYFYFTQWLRAEGKIQLTIYEDQRDRGFKAAVASAAGAGGKEGPLQHITLSEGCPTRCPLVLQGPLSIYCL